MAHNRAKPGLGKSSFWGLSDIASNRKELGFLDFFKARLQGDWVAVPKWDQGAMTRVGMSQTGFVHQVRSLQNCTQNHKVPFSDVFLPTSLLQSHYLFCCSIPWSQSCLPRGHAAIQTLYWWPSLLQWTLFNRNQRFLMPSTRYNHKDCTIKIRNWVDIPIDCYTIK